MENYKEKSRLRKWASGGCALLLAGAVTAIDMNVQAASPGPDGADGIVTVDIIHTNDIHGRSGYEEGSVFGFEKLATYIDTVEPDLVIDAGDLYHGQAFATLEQGEHCRVGESGRLRSADARKP